MSDVDECSGKEAWSGRVGSVLWVVVVIVILYRVVEEGYLAKVAFAQRPEKCEETNNVAI